MNIWVDGRTSPDLSANYDTKTILSILFFVRKYEYSNSFQLKCHEICIK